MRPSRTVSRVLVFTALVSSAAIGGAEAAALSSVTDVQPGHVAWIYRSPDAATARVGYLKAGAHDIQTLGCRRLAKGGWCHVLHLGTRGWVQDRFLKATTVMRG